MADETTATEEKKAQASQDDTRLNAIQESLAELQRQNQILGEVLIKSQQKTQNQQPIKKVTDFYDTTPDEFKQQITSEVAQVIVDSQARQAEKQATLAALGQEFPELNDVTGKGYKKVVEAHGKLPSHLKDTPEGYKLVVHQTAAEMGILPKSKRNEIESENDSFSLSGGGSRMSNEQKTNKKTKLDPRTVELAKLMGRDPDADPKIKERLEKAAQRDQWGRYK